MRKRPFDALNWRSPLGAAVCVGLALTAALHWLASRRLSVGVLNDDAANVLLARSILHGRYALPGEFRTPEGFLPGFPALLAVPAALAAPHWELLRLIPFFFAGLTFWLTWRLAKKFLSDSAALAVTLFTALNPVIMGHSGLIVPYLPYLALSLALIEAVDRPATPTFWLLFTAGAAAAPLFRPHGAVLVVALALALARRHGKVKAAIFLVAGLIPVAAWFAVSRSTSTAFDYPGVWTEHINALIGPAAIVHSVSGILLKMLGQGFVVAPFLPVAGQLLLSVIVMGLAVAGARMLWKSKAPEAYALVVYSVGFFILHMTWPWVGNRYVIPIVPFLWILALVGISPLLKSRKSLSWTLVALLTLLPLSIDLMYAIQGWAADAQFEPQTMAWIRANVPASAKLESVRDYTLALLTDHPCAPQMIVPRGALWLKHAQNERVDFLHLQLPLPQDAFPVATTPAEYQPAFARWLMTRPEITEVYRNEEEGALVFKINR